MNIKEFANSRNITQTKTRELIKEVLNPDEMPKDLTDEQVAKLDQELGKAVATLPSASNELAKSDLADISPSPHTSQVIEILGIQNLKENLVLFLRNASAALSADKSRAETLAFQMEQRYYNDLANHQITSQQETLGRINRNSLIFSSEGFKTLQAGETLNNELDQELEQLLGAFGL